MRNFFYNTANYVKSIKRDTVASFKTLIWNFEGVAIIDHVIDDVSSFYEWKFLLQKGHIICCCKETHAD